MNTHSLLEGLAQEKVPVDAVLLASSANVYGNFVGSVLDQDSLSSFANNRAVCKLAMK